MKSTMIALCAVIAAPLAGCGGTEVVHPTVSVSIGQQLIDLKKARDSGGLSDREYGEQKAALIRGVK